MQQNIEGEDKTQRRNDIDSYQIRISPYQIQESIKEIDAQVKMPLTNKHNTTTKNKK